MAEELRPLSIVQEAGGRLGEPRPGQIGDDLAADRDPARLDAAVALLHGLGPGHVGRRLLTGGSVAEGDGGVAMQLGLVRLHDEQIVALGVPHMAADLALVKMASPVTSAPSSGGP